MDSQQTQRGGLQLLGVLCKAAWDCAGRKQGRGLGGWGGFSQGLQPLGVSWGRKQQGEDKAAGGGFPCQTPSAIASWSPWEGQPSAFLGGEHAWARCRPLPHHPSLSLFQVIPGPERHLGCRMRLWGLPDGAGGPQPLPPAAGQPRGGRSCGEWGASRRGGNSYVVFLLPPPQAFPLRVLLFQQGGSHLGKVASKAGPLPTPQPPPPSALKLPPNQLASLAETS